MNVNVIKLQILMTEKQFERLHKNVNNIIRHLLNLNPFLSKIKALIKKIMITIVDD